MKSFQIRLRWPVRDVRASASLEEALGRAPPPTRTAPLPMSAWTANEQPVAAGEAVFTEIKNVCVWNETNGGMNTF